MRLTRAEIVDPNEVAIFHTMTRTTRRCFLFGDDPLTGRNFDHRKAWIEEALQHQASAFGIDLLAYSVLSNRFHLILRSRPDVVATGMTAKSHGGGSCSARYVVTTMACR